VLFVFRRGRAGGRFRVGGGFRGALRLELRQFLLVLVNVFQVRFEDQQVGAVIAVDLEDIPVVPFDPALDGLAVAHERHDRRLFFHLLLVVEILRVGVR
jgi:hypothetical protein